MKFMRLIRWGWQYYQLTVQAGVVWGIHESTPERMEERILDTPLKYELLRLRREQAALEGRPES